METQLADYLQSLDIKFNDLDIYKNSLVHRSFINETDEEIESNERLEFLGDAVLQYISSSHLYRNFADFTEGELTNLRSKIVNTESLAEESKRLQLYQHLSISKGEKEVASSSDHILANTFEAFIGAIYLDTGINQAKKFLERELFYKVDNIVTTGSLKDSKSLYQEFAQEKYNITPVYKVILEQGPDHDKEFIIGVFLDDKLIAQGEGSSKRKAQQSAAENALRKEENNEKIL